MMKYEGVNREGFDRDARLLNQWRNGLTETDFAIQAGLLARDYGIDSATIWDMLPEYDEEQGGINGQRD